MKIIITGAYAIGTHLARLLSRNHEDITIIDKDPERLAQIGSDYDLLTMEASPESIRALKEAGIAHTDLYIAVTPDQSVNMNNCILAKALGAKKTVARIDNSEYKAPETEECINRLGVDSLIYPEALAAKDINSGLKMSWVRQRWDVHNGALVMLGIKLREGCEILNQPLRTLCGPQDPYHVVAIKRGGETIIPGGNDELKLYDLAYFMTTRQYIPYIRKIVGKEYYVDVKNVMIMGGGTTAVNAVRIMPKYMDVKIIEQNADRCDRLNELLEDSDTLVINGDGRDIALLTEEGEAKRRLLAAEAKAELGTITQDDLDKTVNQLQARAGLPNMTLNPEADPANNMGVSNLIWEIRRCRRCELMTDNWYRYWDLVRWHQLDKLDGNTNVNINRGANLTNMPKLEGDKYTTDANGYLIGLSRVRTYDKKYYFFPIPSSQTTLNKKMKQNPGWE